MPVFILRIEFKSRWFTVLGALLFIARQQVKARGGAVYTAARVGYARRKVLLGVRLV